MRLIPSLVTALFCTSTVWGAPLRIGLPTPADIGAASTSHHVTHSTGGSDPIAPGDIGAATAAQGAKADTAVQPSAVGVTVQPYNAGTVTAITNSTSTTSSTTAASATAVKAAYDLANGKPSLTNTAPNMDGVASAGSGVTAARVDHVHPTDTTRAAVDNPTFTTGVTSPLFTSNAADGTHYVQPYNSTAYSGTCSKGMVQTVGTPASLQVCTADGTWGAVSGTVSSVFGRTGAVVAGTGDYSVAQITGAAPLASPALTGTPTAPTASGGTSSAQIATTAFVASAIASLGSGTIGGTVGTTADRIPVASGTGGNTLKASTVSIDPTTGATTVPKQSGIADGLLFYNGNSTETTGAGFVGPPTTMATSYYLQLPATAPTSGQTIVAGTPATQTVNGVSATVIPATWLTSASGPVTLTTGGTTNASSVSVLGAHYTRLGNEVTVTGKLTFTNSTNANSTVDINLPVASTFTANTDCIGVGTASTTGISADILGSTALNVAKMTVYNTTASGSITVSFVFTYTVK